MTPHELIKKLVNERGPCMRLCCYCPEEHDVAEIKECVESMYKKIYELQAEKDKLLEDLIKIRIAYREATGNEYQNDQN